MKFYRQIFQIHIFLHVLMIYEYKFLNGIPVLSAGKFFSYANEPIGDATKAINDVLDSPFNFCMSRSVGRSKGIPTSSGSWHNGTGF